MKYIHSKFILCVAVLFAVTLAGSSYAIAASAVELNINAEKALAKLYAKSAPAKALGERAKAILVFPSVTKAGLMVGGQYGEGVLIKNGEPVAYYNTVSASYGMQAGVQKYGYVLFLMTDSAEDYLHNSGGWELGVGPSIVVVDVGKAGSMTTTTAKSDIYAFFFDQKGLMAGLGLQGTKVTQISR